jgi:acyl-coenzyme A synthetase/AMP-(fatty) acid ligase
MARELNRKATEPPMSRPMNVLGSATLIWVSGFWNRAEPVSSISSSAPIVSMKLANRATAAMTAEPMAKPLVTALVVLPTASRLTMIRSASPLNSPDISAMPAALSATGPKVSSDTTTPVVASMPMPVRATR